MWFGRRMGWFAVVAASVAIMKPLSESTGGGPWGVWIFLAVCGLAGCVGFYANTGVESVLKITGGIAAVIGVVVGIGMILPSGVKDTLMTIVIGIMVLFGFFYWLGSQ